MFRLFSCFLVLSALTISAIAGANSACIECHEDPDLTRTLSNGAVQSLTVTNLTLAGSRHANLFCVNCHADLAGFDDYPHPEKLKKVNCAACHNEPASAVAKGAHGGKINCAACHGTHDILSPKDPRSVLSPNKANSSCASCHNLLHAPVRGKTAAYATYDVGLHGSHPVAAGADGPGCIECHGAHTVTSEHVLPDKLQASCFECHSEIKEKFRTSVHADIQGNRALSHCFDCHGEHRSRAPSDTTLHVLNETPAEATCGACHAESVARYNQSLHAYALERGSPRAPRCESCHGAHSIYRIDDPRSPVHRSREMQTCAKCHSRIGLAEDPDIRMPLSFENYMESTHGKLLAQGNVDVPVCTDCHGGHSILPRSDPRSTVAHLNIHETCGQCHDEARKEYLSSIHYRALEFGIEYSPTCTGCHGEHLVVSPRRTRLEGGRAQTADEVCVHCHNDPVILRKYGLDPEVVSTYEDSYHGLATRSGRKDTPSCPDCHMAHGVRTQRDSLSTINPVNLTATCAKCHPRANNEFAASYTHRALQPRRGGLNWWIAQIYWIAIIAIIGGMILHNLIIMNYQMLQAKKRQTTGRLIERFDTHALVQHMALSVAFILLAITGFALKYPDAWWVRMLSAVGFTEGLRSLLHRIMAVILVAVSVYHTVYLLMMRKGRDEFKALLPEKSDFVDLINTMRFYLGLGKRTPEYGRYDYMQKAEYWALIWGTLVMIATGFILWFPSELSPLLPSWVISAAQTIHLYEAWLATLAIVVWHFFFVIFHPEEYPMSWTWLTGKISEEAVRHRHARWWKKLEKKEEAKSESEEA
ncbi:cytochrome b/b6 domain-containing protein [bacterium]|nr:cytochrome b/b6 domain-containing protein [bacterium]